MAYRNQDIKAAAKRLEDRLWPAHIPFDTDRNQIRNQCEDACSRAYDAGNHGKLRSNQHVDDIFKRAMSYLL